MTQFGMVIDLAKCNGCGACAFACKAENNTRDRGDQQSFNWADFLMKTEGKFPYTTHSVIPVLCNHCSDAPCIKICPGNPEKAGNPTKDPNGKPYKALYKTPEGITLQDPELCIGCGDCQKACPYSHPTLDATSLTGASYSVISLNTSGEDPQPRWNARGHAFGSKARCCAQVVFGEQLVPLRRLQRAHQPHRRARGPPGAVGGGEP